MEPGASRVLFFGGGGSGFRNMPQPTGAAVQEVAGGTGEGLWNQGLLGFSFGGGGFRV